MVIRYQGDIISEIDIEDFEDIISRYIREVLEEETIIVFGEAPDRLE